MNQIKIKRPNRKRFGLFYNFYLLKLYNDFLPYDFYEYQLDRHHDRTFYDPHREEHQICLPIQYAEPEGIEEKIHSHTYDKYRYDYIFIRRLLFMQEKSENSSDQKC